MNTNIDAYAKKLQLASNTINTWINDYRHYFSNELLANGTLTKSDRILIRELKAAQKKKLSPDETEQKISKAYLKEKYLNYLEEFSGGEKQITSPLRFPGSKSKVLGRFVPYFKTNHFEYREPFLGGGSIFLGKHKAQKNLLNDRDPNIYAFFKAIQDTPNEICNLVLNTNPSIEIWKEKRLIIEHKSLVEKGFDFLFFNRTNYSGIFKANPIGGMNQSSKYLIDCRWNPQKIIESIKLCSIKLKDVEITNYGYEEVITKPGDNVLLIVDPPYYKQGDKLYPISMSHEEHLHLAKLLRETKHKYLLTIDDCPETRAIYLQGNCYENQESWLYTVNSNQSGKLGKELFISNFEVNKYL